MNKVYHEFYVTKNSIHMKSVKQTKLTIHARTITSLSISIVVAVMASCQPGSKDGQKASTEPKDTAATQNLQSAQSSYADVNGLKMYYEVYGKGKPIILQHGSYMNIPMNWSHIIPLLAKDRK